MYQWTNRLGRAEEMSPVEVELYRRGSSDPELARSFLDVMARTKTPREVMTTRRVGQLVAGAVRNGENSGAAVIRRGAADAREAVVESFERVRLPQPYGTMNVKLPLRCCRVSPPVASIILNHTPVSTS